MGHGRAPGPRRQGTLRAPFTMEGVGLHTGRPCLARVEPAAHGHGRVFWREDLPSPLPLPATVRSVVATTLATTIGRGDQRVGMVEHLLAALSMAGIDNALVRVTGPELPALDGSAAPWWDAIMATGREEQTGLVCPIALGQPVEVRDGRRLARLLPAPTLEVRILVDYPHPLLRHVRYAATVDARTFAEELAPARTFVLRGDVERLRQRGMAQGGSLENALVLDELGVMNPGGYRVPDEPVRHKALDLIGDLALLGSPVLGRVEVERGGHDLHVALARAILKAHRYTSGRRA